MIRCELDHPWVSGIRCSAPRGHHDAHEAWLGLVRLIWVGFSRRSA